MKQENDNSFKSGLCFYFFFLFIKYFDVHFLQVFSQFFPKNIQSFSWSLQCVCVCFVCLCKCQCVFWLWVLVHVYVWFSYVLIGVLLLTVSCLRDFCVCFNFAFLVLLTSDLQFVVAGKVVLAFSQLQFVSIFHVVCSYLALRYFWKFRIIVFEKSFLVKFGFR